MTYTLTGDTSLGFRTLAKAVANGDVSDGDTVYYVVVDNTSKGDSTDTLDFERGSGVVGSSGTTITRSDANVTQSSNSGNRVSWPSGGSRTVYIVLDAEAVPLLSEVQTWTAAQTFSAIQTLSAGLQLDGHVDGRARWRSGGGERFRIYVDATSKDARLIMVNTVTGAAEAVLDFATSSVNVALGTLKQGGTAVALQGVLSAPSGFELLTSTPTVPSGWTLVTSSVNDRAVVLTDTAAQAGTLGGTWVISATVTVDGHTLLAAEMPSHDHDITYRTGSGGAAAGPAWKTDGTGIQIEATGSNGGGDPHSHTASATIGGGGTWRPLYRRVITIQKV